MGNISDGIVNGILSLMKFEEEFKIAHSLSPSSIFGIMKKVVLKATLKVERTFFIRIYHIKN